MLVVLPAEAFARALTSGYIGGQNGRASTSTSDSPRAAQIFAFEEPINRSVLSRVGQDSAVFLEIDASGLDLENIAPKVFSVGSQLRISKVERALFQSRDGLRNFEATYFQFPDIPSELISTEVAEITFEDGSKPDLEMQIPAVSDGVLIDLDRRDASCGLSAILVEQLLQGGLDEQVSGWLQLEPEKYEQGHLWRGIALTALDSIDPEVAEVDTVIWGEFFEAAIGHRSERGFDRRSLLEEVRGRLPAFILEQPKVAKWFAVAKDVLEARRDPPPFDDEGSIGRRAALAALINHDFASLADLNMGKKVGFLVKIFIGAFNGLSRLPANFKGESRRLDATLEIGERLEKGEPSALQVTGQTSTEDLAHLDILMLDDVLLFERKADPLPHRMMLRARALEAGLRLAPEEKSGRLRVYLNEEDAVRIYVDDGPVSPMVNPVVRFWTPVVKITARTPSAAKMRDILALSWHSGCSIGTYKVDGNLMLCAYVFVLTNTLDREEFDFYIASLEKFVNDMTTI